MFGKTETIIGVLKVVMSKLLDAPNVVDGVHMHLENKKISKNFFWMYRLCR